MGSNPINPLGFVCLNTIYINVNRIRMIRTSQAYLRANPTDSLTKSH